MGIKPTGLNQHIEQAKKGNQLAFKKLLDAHWSQVYNFQLKQTENEFAAEEISIQTFAKAFDKISTYNPDYKFLTWLITISKNIQIDLSRVKELPVTKVDQFTAKNIVDETPTAEDQLIEDQDTNKLLSFVTQLKPHYQEVIQLRFFEELPYKTIARRIDEPISNVKVKLMRAKKLLAEIIKSET